MSVNLSPIGGGAAQFFNNDGTVLSGGKLNTYTAGTTTPATTYTTSAGTIAHANPIILNSAGRVSGSGEVWLTDGISYKFVLTDANNVLIATYDNIFGIGDTTALLNFEATLASSTGSSLVGYQLSGTGTVSTTVQAKLRQTVSVEDFGAVCDGTTDDANAFQLALNYSAANKCYLTWTGNMAVKSTVTCPGAIKIIGRGLDSTILTLFNNASLRTTIQSGSGVLQSMTIQDANDQASIGANPLVQIAGAFGYSVNLVLFNGQNKRRYGLWIGKGTTCWGSSFIRNQFFQCQVGVVIGDTQDATHNFFSANTVDHNLICGAVFCNPHNGEIVSNSFEQNEGYVGLAILSYANGGTTQAKNVTITGNYIFNNGINYAGNVNVNGVTAGIDVYGSDFTTPGTNELTSGSAVSQMDLRQNYIVSDHQNRAFKLNVFRGCQIVDNTVLKSSGSSYEGELLGIPTFTSVDGNFNQNTGNLAAILTESSQVYLTPAYNGSSTITLGETTVGYQNKSQFRNKSATGASGVWTDIFNTTTEFDSLSGTDSGIAQILIAVQQTNTNNQSVSVLYVSSRMLAATAADYSLVYSNPAVLPDNRQFRISSGILQLKSDNAWNATLTIIAVGAAF